jgi:hypothetical protein
MSLVIDFVAIAEGVAADARGILTLVAVNSSALIADQLPTQFGPILVVVAVDDELANPVIAAGRTLAGRIEVVSPDNETLFVTQLRQGIVPSAVPAIPPRVQVVAQVPFTATKTGEYRLSAHITVVDEGERIVGEVTAVRRVWVLDSASSRPRTA